MAHGHPGRCRGVSDAEPGQVALHRGIQLDLAGFGLRVVEHLVNEAQQQPLADRVLRPALVILSAGAFGYSGKYQYDLAAIVEFIHTATLLHDDVVDESFKRRNFFSINALWKNKIAVLVGDYLLSKGLLLSINNGDFELLKIVSQAVEQMSEGELLQIEKARHLDIDEKIYYEVIRQKTASLIASCCSCGAASAGADERTVEQMRLFGEKIGLAFQIKDDLFDFGTDDIGKPLGIDIKEKKMTLPLIFALSKSDRSQKRHIINLVKNHNEEAEKVAEVISFVRSSGGLDYAHKQMLHYQEEAFEILKSFPEHPSRTALEQLVRFTTERKK